MEWKKLVMFTLILLVTTSCSLFLNYEYNDTGGLRPKKLRFELTKIPYQLTKRDNLDTNAIYIKKHPIKVENGEVIEEQTFLRFFANGRYLISGSQFQKELNLEDINNLSRGFVGYYEIKQNKYLYGEFFWIRYNEGGRYVKEYGLLEEDKIFMFKSPPENGVFPKPNKNNCNIYIRKKIQGLSETSPDW
ncbi:hypothetical protein ACSTS3_00030 [Aquimarina muelleri]|uniref:hypothetical protein n=1 Tax=Aquimarina muelleri TaxID=279356 RepID=UPI003F688377